MRFFRNLGNGFADAIGLWADELRTGRTLIQAVHVNKSLTRLEALTGNTALADEALEAAAMLAAVAATPAQMQILAKIIAKGRLDTEDITQLLNTLPDRKVTP